MVTKCSSEIATMKMGGNKTNKTKQKKKIVLFKNRNMQITIIQGDY